MNILIVEDDRINQLLLKRFLQQDDHNVVVCNNGSEAIDIIEKKPDFFDVIVTDIMMPCCSGEELIEKYKNKYKIIVITTISKYNFPKHLLKYISWYLEKPEGTYEILDAINNL